VGASGNKGLMQRYKISLYLSNNVACAASSLGALCVMLHEINYKFATTPKHNKLP